MATLLPRNKPVPIAPPSPIITSCARLNALCRPASRAAISVASTEALLVFDSVGENRLALRHEREHRLIGGGIDARVLILRQHPLPHGVRSLLGGQAAFERPLLVGRIVG